MTSTQDALLNAPRLNLTDRQFYDLEMLLVGGFAPLTGFLNEADYRSVVDDMKLADGSIWPIPIVLDVAMPDNYVVGQDLVLCDQYGTPHAVMQVESIYNPDKLDEALRVYGTTDETHAGVHYLMHNTHNTYLGGPVTMVKQPEHYDFAELRKTPAEVKAELADRGVDKIVGFQTRNPVHRSHYELMRKAAADHDAHVLLHPVVGLTKPGDIDHITRVRGYKALHEERMQDFASISLLPLAMRMAGPREAVWHALVRKNYGCTHFIVGRDHAGPGKDKAGQPFYGLFDAIELAQKHAADIGMEIIPGGEQVYVEELGVYQNRDDVAADHTVKSISGTQFRQMLRDGDDIPEWFAFPEMVRELRIGIEKEKRRGFTLFFTGLSGAGKSTIATIVQHRLYELQDRNVTILDGDVVRDHLSKGLGFSKVDRDTNVERIGFVAGEVSKHGGICICAAIAPYAAARSKARALVESYGDFIEIHVDTPVEECERRDKKGLYEKARKGLIKNFTGVDDPYEVPESAEITLSTTDTTAKENAERVIEYLQNNNLLS